MGIIQHFKDEEDYTSNVIRDEYDGSVIARIPLKEDEKIEPIFEFTNFQQWVNKAQGWCASYGVTSKNSVWIDAKGRVSRNGGDMMRARDDNAFPVKVFWK